MNLEDVYLNVISSEALEDEQAEDDEGAEPATEGRETNMKDDGERKATDTEETTDA